MNLAYRWFCGLGLEDKVPDHSTFSVNRHGRFRESDILRQVFEEVVCGCMTAGLVGGEGFAVDASVIEANASRFQRVEGREVDWTEEQRASRPVQEYLVALESENPPIKLRRKRKMSAPSKSGHRKAVPLGLLQHPRLQTDIQRPEIEVRSSPNSGHSKQGWKCLKVTQVCVKTRMPNPSAQ